MAETLTEAENATIPRSPHAAIVVVDFGSQYSMLIARRIRELNTYCEVIPYDAEASVLDHLDVRGFVLSGGPNSVYDEGAPHTADWVFESGRPVLGICYGMQLLAEQLGGKVGPGARARIRAGDDLRLGERAAAGRAAHRARCLDEPRRPDRGDAAGLRVAGRLGELTDRGHGGCGAGLLRPAVPPGGGTHAAGWRADRELRAGSVQGGGGLDAGQLRRGSGGHDSRAGRRRAGGLRALGRRRQRRSGDARAPRHRRPVDVHLRRQRAAAGAGGRGGGRHLRAQSEHEPAAHRRAGPLPSRCWRR